MPKMIYLVFAFDVDRFDVVAAYSTRSAADAAFSSLRKQVALADRRMERWQKMYGGGIDEDAIYGETAVACYPKSPVFREFFINECRLDPRMAKVKMI